MIQLDDGLDAFSLTLSDCGVQRRPVVSISQVGFRAVLKQKLGDVGALLWVLAEQTHDEMKCCFAIQVSPVHVGATLNQGLDQPNFETHYC